uniref:DUF4455 domain-containing protein n=1 Tax=Syphacia muris TaxID=451379 RepID=A0A0N5B196_9BILA
MKQFLYKAESCEAEQFILAMFRDRFKTSSISDTFVVCLQTSDIEQEAKQGSIQKESSKPACDANNISKRKMEFFSRLERLRDNIVELRDQNAQWNTIYLSQIDEVSECLDELLTRAKDSLTLEAKSLCDEIETIRASFFQLECNRIKERFRMLLLQLEQIVELMTARKRLILKVEEFKKFLDERGGTVCVVGTDVLDHDGVYLEKTREGVAYNEMLAFEETLGAFQRDAQMIIVDLASLNIFETFPVSSSCKPKERPTFISQNFQEFINKTEEFESLLLSFCKTAVSNDSTIQESMERKRAENFYELEKMADTLDGDERRKAVERLKKLSLAAFGSSNDSLEFKIMQLNARHNFIDGSIKKCIQNFDIKKVEEIEKKLWTPWKIELSELEKSVTGNETIQKHFGALEKLAFELDGRICRFKHAVSKRQRREENLFKKLNLFATWLNLVEREVMNLNLLSDSQENNVQQKNKLVGSIALHQQLVLKLERTCFLFNQRAEIRDYCKRYWDLVSKISQWSVPNTKLLQTCFDAEIPSTSKDSEAALNFPTASSTDEDYDSDIRSIEKELYIGELSSSPLQNTNLFMKVTQAYHEGDIEVLLPEIDDEIAGISNRLGVIKCSYAKRLKRLEEASDDYKRLLDIQKCHTDLEVICRILSTRVAGDTATKLWTFFCHLLRTSPFINDQIIVLKREIDDETDLRSNYGNVLAYFKKLRAYAGIPKNNITLVKGMIDEIGLQLSCFCKQYFARRKYVENSIKVLAASNDGKMSPWEEIVSLTSGAIMPVVEALDEELDKTLKEDKKDELVALRSKLQQLLNNVNERYGCDSTEDVLDETEKAKDNVKVGNIRDFSNKGAEGLNLSLSPALEPDAHLGVSSTFKANKTGMYGGINHEVRTLSPFKFLLAFENRNQEEADQYLKKASEHPCITTCVKFVENHIIEATKCLITKIEQLLCDKSTTIEALLQTLGEIDSLLSYCGHLQQDDLTESLPQELYTLSSKLELLKKKLKERCDTWDAFKFECDSLNNILNEVRQTLKPVREDSHITMEEEIHNRLATCSQHIQGLEGNLKRIQQFAESLAPMETASKEVSRIKNDYDEVYNDLLDTKTKAVRKTKEQNTQKIKEPQSAHSKETKVSPKKFPP